MAEPQRTRVLQFPAERSLGTLSAVNFDGLHPWVFLRGRYLGPAQGAVAVELGADESLSLDSRLDTADDFAALARLGPADLDGLRFFAPKDAANPLDYLRPLYGLRKLFLMGRTLTDADLHPLQDLAALDSLMLNNMPATTGAGLLALRSLPQLRLLYTLLVPIRQEHGQAIGQIESLEYLELLGSEITGPILPHLRTLAHLKTLTAMYFPVPDDDLAHLEALPTLRRLELAFTGVADRGLVHIGRMHLLRRLGLAGAPISDQGLSHLARLSNLEGLSLVNTSITDAGLANLTPLTHLKQLKLGRTQVSDRGLATLAHLTQLEQLSTGKQITDAGLPHLLRMQKLRWLDLGGTQVTDAGLRHLQQLPSLAWLDLTHTGVTPPGAAWLRERLPECQIHPLPETPPTPSVA